MSKTVDNELLLGFFAEAKSYLPEIMQGVVDFRANPAQVDRLGISYRYAHTIKGASSMIGLETLSRVAAHLEEIFEDIAAGRMTLNESTAAAVGYTVALISTYLDSAAQGNFNERPFLSEALDSLRRLRDFSEGKGLPFIAESTDEEIGAADEAPPENPIFEREAEPPAFEEAVLQQENATSVETTQVETASVETTQVEAAHRYDTAPLASNPITDAEEFSQAPPRIESGEETTGALASEESNQVAFSVTEGGPLASPETAASQRVEVTALMKVEPTGDDVLGISHIEQLHSPSVESRTDEEWDGIVFENPDWTIESQPPAPVEPALDVDAFENPVREASPESAVISSEEPAAERAIAQEATETPALESASETVTESAIEIPVFDDRIEQPELPAELHEETEQAVEQATIEQTTEPAVEQSEVESRVEDGALGQTQEAASQEAALQEEVLQSALIEKASAPVEAELPPTGFAFHEEIEEPSFETDNLSDEEALVVSHEAEEPSVEERIEETSAMVAHSEAIEEAELREAEEAVSTEVVAEEIAAEPSVAEVEATEIYQEEVQGVQTAEDHQAEVPSAEVQAKVDEEVGEEASASVEDEKDHVYQASVPSEFLEVFMLEAEDHLRTLHQVLPMLVDQPANRALIQEIRRSAHSLKGSAGMVGFGEITRLAHRMEDLLDLLYDGAMSLNAEKLNLLFLSTDALEDMTSGKVNRRTLDSLYAEYDQLIGAEEVEQATEPSEEFEEEVAEEAPASDVEFAQLDAAEVAGLQKQGQFMRVPITRLNEMVKLVTELIIARSSFEQRLADFSQQLRELQSSSNRLRRVSSKMDIQYEASTLGSGLSSLAPVSFAAASAAGVPITPLMNVNTHGFDDLEFDRYTEFHLALRELSETASDVQTLDAELVALKTDFEAYLSRQKHLYSEIQDKLMRMRMVPVSTLAARLQRGVRTVASQRGKRVRLIIEGEGTELDKTVLEELADPFLHMLRNAVDHGIESPAERRARGKDEAGAIKLRAYTEGTQVVIQVSDDGRGIDPESLRSTAVAKGHLSVFDAAQMSDEELYSLIFLPGFSTAQELSEISGRGVGLDVVRATVHGLKGHLTVDSRTGEGVTFTIRLPMTLAVMRGLLARAGNQTFAIPVSGVTQVARIAHEDIEIVGQEETARVGEKVYPMVHLGRLLNLAYPVDESVRRRPVLIMNIDDREVAVAVDDTLGAREIVVKNLGNHLRHVHGVTGATLMGDGSVVLILNVPELVRGATRARMDTGPLPPVKQTVTRRALTVMVVDDSPSVRRVVTSLLQNAGWKTVQAKDGLDAFETLPQLPALPDVILLDIEMPRMDGYEFLSTLRKQEAYSHIPVAILTSRAGQKHREKAFELGADEYIVKPYRDEALLDLLLRLARQQRQVRQ
jgi:chemosensory pili system protein ChpA (sensor histidine kinase/response regulator)